MFFTISKITGYLLHPFAWIVIFLILAVVFKNPKKRKRFLILTLLTLIIFSNQFICDEALRLWEKPNVKIAAGGNKLVQLQMDKLDDGIRIPAYDAAILLGGDIVTYEKNTGKLIFRSGADRLLQTIHLYKKGVIRKIVISGGSGHLIYKDRTEATFIKNYLTSIGIPSDYILFESSSRNTIENARNSSLLLKDNHIKGRVLLITSALHMRRAAATFEKAGIPVDEYPTAKISGPRMKNFDHLIIPSVNSLHNWNILIHEVLGFVVYKIMGYC